MLSFLRCQFCGNMHVASGAFHCHIEYTIQIVVVYYCLYLLSYYNCRLDIKYSLCNIFKLFMCAICQVEIKLGEGISIHDGSSSTRNFHPWDGPFLCSSFQEKKGAMEGKQPFGSKITYFLHNLYSSSVKIIDHPFSLLLQIEDIIVTVTN